MAEQPGFAPTAMFSALEANTHIPAHTGSTNVRLLCHLPLVLPGPARFRVGNEVREWKLGQAWIFDDTIEHEAWNDADQLRVILIFDVWNPYLEPGERERVNALMAGGGIKRTHMTTNVQASATAVPAASEKILAVNNIEVVYDHVILVLKGVSLDVPTAGITALLGANGAGKTTTLKAISNLLHSERGEVTKGSIVFDGEAVQAR